VDAYFAQVLLPVLPPGSVIVLDNARFHQSPTTRRWSPPPAVRCCSAGLLADLIPSNTCGPPSKPTPQPATAATQPFLSA